MASCLTFRSFIHFEFIFVYGVRKWSRFILLHVAVQFSEHHLWKLFLCHWIFFPFVRDQLAICLWVHFWVLYSAPLIKVSVFVPVPYCLHDYSFVIHLEVWDCDASRFGFFFQDCFGYLGSILVPCKFQDCFFQLCEKCCWYLDKYCIKCVNYFGSIDILIIFFF